MEHLIILDQSWAFKKPGIIRAHHTILDQSWGCLITINGRPHITGRLALLKPTTMVRSFQLCAYITYIFFKHLKDKLVSRNEIILKFLKMTQIK